MQKIVFVCLGNICRSPLAEALFQNEIEKRGMTHLFELDSCGTNGLHNGERADARTRKNAIAHGIEVPSISRKITANDIQHFDLLLTMDEEVQSKVLNLCKTEEEKQKVVLFREFDPKSPGSEVPDPWYGGDEGFENVFQIVKENTEIWVNRLC